MRFTISITFFLLCFATFAQPTTVVFDKELTELSKAGSPPNNGCTICTDKNNNKHFIYTEISSCGANGSGALSFLSRLGQAIGQTEIDKQCKAEGITSKYSWELKQDESQKTVYIAPHKPTPDGNYNSTDSYQARVFIPLKGIECTPFGESDCNKSKLVKMDYTNPVTTEKSSVCGGTITYTMADGKKISEEWNATTFISKCEHALSVQNDSKSLVDSQLVDYPIGVCSFFQQLSGTIVRGNFPKEYSEYEAEPRVYCFLTANVGSEKNCTGARKEAPKPSPTPTVPPTPTARPAPTATPTPVPCPENQVRNEITGFCNCIDQEKILNEDNRCVFRCPDGQMVEKKDDCPKIAPPADRDSCCSGYTKNSYESLCTTKGRDPNPTFQLVWCIGKFQWSRTTTEMLSCKTHPECCDIEKNYSNSKIVQQCDSYLTHKER